MRPPVGADGQRVDPMKGISDLRGRIEIVIEGAAEADPDWSVGVLIGPGEIPAEPQATITLGAAEADAIRTGDLHPLEAPDHGPAPARRGPGPDPPDAGRGHDPVHGGGRGRFPLAGGRYFR